MAAQVPIQLDPRMIRLSNYYSRLMGERFSEFMSRNPHLDPDDPDWSREDRAALTASDADLAAECEAACAALAQEILAERELAARRTA